MRSQGAHSLLLQAVMYFRRALKLDRHYLSAWTLMGHEYVEMKNTSAAIGVSWHVASFALCLFYRMSTGHMTLVQR